MADIRISDLPDQMQWSRANVGSNLTATNGIADALTYTARGDYIFVESAAATTLTIPSCFMDSGNKLLLLLEDVQ